MTQRYTLPKRHFRTVSKRGADPNEIPAGTPFVPTPEELETFKRLLKPFHEPVPEPEPEPALETIFPETEEGWTNEKVKELTKHLDPLNVEESIELLEQGLKEGVISPDAFLRAEEEGKNRRTVIRAARELIRQEQYSDD